MNIKQVIVVRKDLKARKGKMMTQAAHASFRAVSDQGTLVEDAEGRWLKIPVDDALHAWLTDGLHKKITVGVESEAELMMVYQEAMKRGLPCALIQDLGLTEFSEPTYTSVGIGPAPAEAVDAITGHLPLL